MQTVRDYSNDKFEKYQSDMTKVDRNVAEKKKDVFEIIFSYLLISFAFLFPIFFLPILGNPLLGAKLILLVSYAVILSLLTIIKIIANKNISWGKSAFDIPMFIFILAVSIATIFSSSNEQSIFGNYGSFFPSVVSVFSFGIIYFSIVAHIKKQKYLESIKIAFIISIVIASLFAILNYLGIYLIPSEIAKNRNFNLVGSNEILAFLSVLVSIQLVIYYLKETETYKKVLYLSPLLILVAASIIFGGLAVVAVLAVGVLLTIYMGHISLQKGSVLTLSVLIIISLSIGLSARFLLKNDEYVNNIKLPPAVSWIVSTTALRDYPISGSGMGTFSNVYTRYKPDAFSSSELSELRFNYPYSDYLLYISELGIAGFLAFLFIAVSVLRKVKSVREYHETGEKDSIYLVMDFVLLVALFVGLFFISMNITAFLFFIIILSALGIELSKIENIDPLENKALDESSILGVGNDLLLKSGSVTKYIMLLYIAVVMVGGTYFVTKFSIAEVNYKMASDAARDNDVIKTVKYFDQTINSFRYYDVYYRDYSLINLLIANSILSDESGNPKEDLSVDESTEVQQRYELALALLNDAININPLNSLNHVARGDLYNSTLGKTEDVENAGNTALQSYTNAEQLDPGNVGIKMKIGGLYTSFNNPTTAAQYYLRSVNLNPKFVNGYYNLAVALKSAKDYQNAVTAMNNVVLLLDKESEDYKKATDELEELKKLVEENKDTNNTNEGSNLNVEPVEEEEDK